MCVRGRLAGRGRCPLIPSEGGWQAALLPPLDPISPSTNQAAEPLFSALFSYLFMGDMPPLPVLLTLLPIVGGVVIASASEASFNWGGFLSAVASNITFQSRNVLSKKLMISSVREKAQGRRVMPPTRCLV